MNDHPLAFIARTALTGTCTLHTTVKNEHLPTLHGDSYKTYTGDYGVSAMISQYTNDLREAMSMWEPTYKNRVKSINITRDQNNGNALNLCLKVEVIHKTNLIIPYNDIGKNKN